MVAVAGNSSSGSLSGSTTRNPGKRPRPGDRVRGAEGLESKSRDELVRARAARRRCRQPIRQSLRCAVDHECDPQPRGRGRRGSGAGARRTDRGSRGARGGRRACPQPTRGCPGSERSAPEACRWISPHDGSSRLALRPSADAWAMTDSGRSASIASTVELADVVQIDVDRQARRFENEQIERGAALQCETPLEIRMALEPVEEIEEQGDFFEDLGTEPRGRRLPIEPFAGEPHDGSSHAWAMTDSGTTRFHPATSRALPESRFSK